MEMFLVTVGVLGALINLVAYGLMTTGRVRAQEMRYQLMNIVGTTGILLSLLAQWNLPSFLLNLAWLAIGVVAVLRIMRARKTMAP